jgi:1-acyl-sn-glycerol-3-phosphate acyltransferase
MDVWYSCAKSIVRVYLSLFVDKIHVSGGSLLPVGPKIIIANHTNVSDAFVLPFLTKEKIHFLIQAETFTLPVIGRLLTLADQIPVYLGQGRDALEAARQRLSLGHSVAIFPEGRLNDGRNFHRAGAGAALLALESGVPIVPVGFFVPEKYARPIKGHFHQRDTLGRWQFGGQCFVRIGDPWQLTTSIQEKVNYRELRKTTEKMMNRVTELVSLAQDEARRLGVLP